VSELHLLAITVGSLLFTLLACIAVCALRTFSRHDLEEIARRRGNPRRFSEVLQLHESVCLSLELLAIITTSLAIIAGYLWSAGNSIAVGTLTWESLLIAALVAGFIVAAVVNWIPRAVAHVFAEGYLYFTWPLWRLMALVAIPLVWGTKVCDVVLHRVLGRTPQHHDEERIEEEIRTIVSEGHREGLLEEDAREMIEGVIDLGDADVAEIMTPRTDMHVVSVNMDWDALVADVIESGHTRIPVYEKNRDNIIGVLYSKDLLPELATGDVESRTPIGDLLRKPVFVPETKPVNDLLQMFQQMRTHIAVVLDEYGGVSGLVTIEDVLEEIVGEIVDEYDREEVEEIQQIDENTCEALGRAHVDEINEWMNLELPDDGDFDTIGGFVFTELGHVPLPGESLIWQDQVQIQVLEATKRRIEKVRIQKLTDDQRESA